MSPRHHRLSPIPYAEPRGWGRDLDALVRLAERHGVAYDTRSKFQVVTELRKADPAVSPVIVPKALLTPQHDGSLKSRISIDGREVVSLGGLSNRTTVFCNESGQWVSYLSDEHGFHNPSGIWNRGDLDIAVVGDSYAQGVCVPSDSNAVALIRDRYPATLNLGMLGNGPLRELALLKEYAAVLRPRIVLWFLCEENDFADLQGAQIAVASSAHAARWPAGREYTAGIGVEQLGTSMPSTVFLAKVLGIGLGIIGALLLIRRRYFVEVFAGYVEQRLVRAVVSMSELLAGLFLIAAHNIWSPLPAAIVSLLGWMAVIEATAFLFLSDAALGRLMATFNTQAWYLVGGLLGMSVGLYLTGFGFGWW